MERLPGSLPATGKGNLAGGSRRCNFCPVAIRKGEG